MDRTQAPRRSRCSRAWEAGLCTDSSSSGLSLSGCQQPAEAPAYLPHPSQAPAARARVPGHSVQEFLGWRWVMTSCAVQGPGFYLNTFQMWTQLPGSLAPAGAPVCKLLGKQSRRQGAAPQSAARPHGCTRGARHSACCFRLPHCLGPGSSQPSPGFQGLQVAWEKLPTVCGWGGVESTTHTWTGCFCQPPGLGRTGPSSPPLALAGAVA